MRTPGTAAWVAFACFAWGASPSHYWLDSGEIGAAGYDLGVSHPPGAPGLGLLLRLATVVPIGSLGFRMALVSCGLAAMVVGLVVAMMQRRGASRALACIAGAWVAVGLTFVRHARVVEIYALAAALLMVVLWGLDPRVPTEQRTSRRLLAVAAATWAAWCFGDLRLALGPVVLVAFIVAWRSREAWARWAPVLVAMTTWVVLTLPLASVGATVDWGDPDSWSRLVDHLSARSIREAYAEEILPASAPLWWLHAGEAVERLAEDLGAPGIVVAAVGLGLAWRSDPRAPPTTVRAEALAVLWLVATELSFAVGINPMGGPDRQTGLVLGPIAALLVGDMLRRWLRDRGRLAWAVLPLAAAVLVIPPALYSGPDLVVTRSWGPHAWTRGALAQLPPRTLLLTQSDDLAAGTISARLLEGARPDVVAIAAQHLYRPMPDAAANDPRQAVIWQAAAHESREADRIVAAITAHAGPVALELPRTAIFADVPWWSPYGRLPLAVGGVPTERPWVRSEVSPPEEINRWLPRLPSGLDRQRLAMALAGWARAKIKVDGAVALAGATLELSLAVVDERHASALVSLAAVRDRVGDTAGAIALTRRALELEPGRHAALTNLALYLSRDPSTQDEAVIVARRACELRPWRADGWARLAQVLDLSGDRKGAAAARERARGAVP